MYTGITDFRRNQVILLYIICFLFFVDPYGPLILFCLIRPVRHLNPLLCFVPGLSAEEIFGFQWFTAWLPERRPAETAIFIRLCLNLSLIHISIKATQPMADTTAGPRLATADAAVARLNC